MNTTVKLKQAANRVNGVLYRLGLKYHDYIPVYEIDSALVNNGFEATEPAIYCGADGQIHEEVGHGMYLTMTWHKMEETGRYEIVAYLN